MATTTCPNLYLITAAPGWSALPQCAQDVFTDVVGYLSYSACTYINVPVTNIVSCFCNTVQQSILSNLLVYGGEQYCSCPASDLPSATNLFNAYCTANDGGKLATGTLAPSWDAWSVTAGTANTPSNTSPSQDPSGDSVALAPGSEAAIVFALLFLMVTFVLLGTVCYFTRHRRERGTRSRNSQPRAQSSAAGHVHNWLMRDGRAR